jgi:hypothetical protein
MLPPVHRGVKQAMKYRVVFEERTDGRGNPSEKPPLFVEPELTDDIVLDAVFVERLEPDSLHGGDEMDEDDSFLSIGTEVWEYDVADGKDVEFTDALKNSKMVIEYEELEDEPSTETLS